MSKTTGCEMHFNINYTTGLEYGNNCNFLVVLGFNATLTAKVISWRWK